MTDSEKKEISYVLSQLRQAYKMLHAESVHRQREFAVGLIAPQITTLESLTEDKCA